jgi:hypothetical protein
MDLLIARFVSQFDPLFAVNPNQPKIEAPSFSFARSSSVYTVDIVIVRVSRIVGATLCDGPLRRSTGHSQTLRRIGQNQRLCASRQTDDTTNCAYR